MEKETKGEGEHCIPLLATLSHSYTLSAFKDHSRIHLVIEAFSLGLGEINTWTEARKQRNLWAMK